MMLLRNFMRSPTPLAIVCVAVVSSLSIGIGYAMSTVLEKPSGAFAERSLDGWSERSFDGNTHYELIDENGINVLRGHTMSKASILYREQTIDLNATPIINWSWKVDRTYMNIDEKSRGGDDFPARLYVVAQTGFLPWETLAINYVWVSDSRIGDSWNNPFTRKAKMVAIQSGDTHVGEWTLQSRDVAADFRQLFDREIDELSGYAVMVDGDNAQMEAVAWFGEISFNPRR